MNQIEKDVLQNVVKTSKSKIECFKLLNMHPKSSYSYKILNYYIKLYDIDISHFQVDTNINQSAPIDIKDILIGKHPLYSTSHLRVRLIKEGIFEHRCQRCQLSQWNDLPIPLDLDHINGIPTDHRLENLRLLCRNCHAQTTTFCGKNSYKKKPEKVQWFVSNLKKGRLTEKVRKDLELLKNCNIDFSKYGWVTELSILLNKKPQKINKWLKTYAPEILSGAFQRTFQRL